MKLLVYGGHGAGKTELVGSAVDVAEMRDVLMVDVESGDMTLSESPRIENAHLADHIKLDKFRTAAFIHEFLIAHCKAREANDEVRLKNLQDQVFGESVPDPERLRRYRTVIIDSLTELEAYNTYDILGIKQDKIPEADKMEVAGWPEFRKNFEMVKLLVRSFRDLPMNVLITCGQTYTTDETKKFHYTPYLTGKLAVQVQGFMDIVGWLVPQPPTEQGKPAPRRMYVQPIQGPGIPRFDAKNRRASFKGQYFDDPLMKDIMSATGLAK